MRNPLWILKYVTVGMPDSKPISEEEAKSMLTKYNAAFPQLSKYQKKIAQELKK